MPVVQSEDARSSYHAGVVRLRSLLLLHLQHLCKSVKDNAVVALPKLCVVGCWSNLVSFGVNLLVGSSCKLCIVLNWSMPNKWQQIGLLNPLPRVSSFIHLSIYIRHILSL